MIRELFVSPTFFSSSDASNIEKFISSEKDYWNYIPKDIPNKNNLAHIISFIYEEETNYRYFWDIINSEVMDKMVALFHNVNEVLRLILYMSDRKEKPDFNRVQSFKKFNATEIKFIFKILDHCDSTTRYDDFMKYQLIWSRFCGTLDPHLQELRVKHKEVIEDLLAVAKDYYFRGILLRRRNKIFLDKKEDMDLDTYFKNRLEKAIQNDPYLPNYPQLKISIKRCRLLYCRLTLNEDQEMEFENGKLFTPPPSDLTNTTIEIKTPVNDTNNNNSSNNNTSNNNNENDQTQMVAENKEENQVIKIEETLMEHLKEIVEIETKEIRNKLNLVLSLNENMYSIGYIMEINVVEILALYTPYELEELSHFLIEQLVSSADERLAFPRFPHEYLDIKKSFYSSYCKWLYRLHRIFHYDETVIPMSFKKFLFSDTTKIEEKVVKEKEKEVEEEDEDEEDENKNEEENEEDENRNEEENEEENGEENEEENEEEKEEKEEKEKEKDKEKEKEKIEKEKDKEKEKEKIEVEDKITKRKRIKYEMTIDTNDTGLKNIMLGERKEFYQTIIRIMGAPEAGNSNDLTNIKTFIQYEKDHLKYIPETIQNKENLVNIVHLLLKHYSNETIPEHVLVPLFRNVNDVLRLALVLSGHSASDLGKAQRFKSFSNPERRLLMKFLNNCGGDRYDDFIKYHNVWSRFFEKIHPLKFKTLYPDLIEDLLGTYRFMGDPKNKQMRMEYTFYQILMKLNERIVKYREDTLKLIQHKELVENASTYSSRYITDSRIEDAKPFFNLEFLEQKELDPKDNKNPTVNYDRIPKYDLEKVRTIVKNIRINKVLVARDLPLTETEHEKIFEKFNNLKMISEEMKNYLYSYLQRLVPIFSGGLKALNEIYYKFWSSTDRGDVSKEYYEEYILALKANSIPLYSAAIPVLDVDLIQNRMNEILPQLNQLNERSHNYRQERQPFNSKW
eukprot:jgi/Orpsp1_1/1179301/evm.model.c7180000068820.1